MQDIFKKINTMMLFLKSGERGFFIDNSHYVIYNKTTGNWTNDRGQLIIDNDIIAMSNEKLYDFLKVDVRRKIQNDLINDAVRRLDMSWCVEDSW